jgi:hypothetical protein
MLPLIIMLSPGLLPSTSAICIILPDGYKGYIGRILHKVYISKEKCFSLRVSPQQNVLQLLHFRGMGSLWLLFKRFWTLFELKTAVFIKNANKSPPNGGQSGILQRTL